MSCNATPIEALPSGLFTKTYEDWGYGRRQQPYPAFGLDTNTCSTITIKIASRGRNANTGGEIYFEAGDEIAVNVLVNGDTITKTTPYNTVGTFIFDVNRSPFRVQLWSTHMKGVLASATARCTTATGI